MKRDFFADQASEIGRPLSEAEIAATGGLVLGCRLLEHPRKRKRALRRAREKVRHDELGPKAKSRN
jgi:hypothetical protein